MSQIKRGRYVAHQVELGRLRQRATSRWRSTGRYLPSGPSSRWSRRKCPSATRTVAGWSSGPSFISQFHNRLHRIGKLRRDRSHLDEDTPPIVKGCCSKPRNRQASPEAESPTISLDLGRLRQLRCPGPHSRLPRPARGPAPAARSPAGTAQPPRLPEPLIVARRSPSADRS